VIAALDDFLGQSDICQFLHLKTTVGDIEQIQTRF